MHNAYIASTIYAVRGKGSVSFCFSDYYNSLYLLNDRYERSPIHGSFSQCCSCCGFSSHKLPVSSCSLYGPRQSSLLQWSASRKLIFCGGDSYYCHYYNCSPVYGLKRSCCDVSCCVNERIVCNSNRRRSKVRCCCVAVEEGDSGICDSRHVNDTEALLSLLSEGGDEEGSRVGGSGKRRNWGSCRRVEVKGKGDFSGRERNLGSYERLQVKERVSDDGICECGKKKNVGLRLGDGDRNRVSGAVRIESRDEGLRRNEKESEAILRGENLRQRKGSSSCSSYYSLSSSGDLDDESEVHDKHTLLAEETFSGYEGFRLKGEGRFDGQVIEKYQGYGDDIDKHSEQRNTAVASAVGWDRKNKLAKKRSDRLVEEAQESGRESSQRRSRVLGTHGSSHERISSSHKEFNDKKETSTLAVNVDRHTRKQYAQNENQVGEASTSRRTFAENKEIQEIHQDDVKGASKSRIRIGSSEENLEIAKDEQHKAVSYQAEEENINRNSQIGRVSEVQDFDTQRTSILQNHSEIGVTGVAKYRKNVFSSLQGREQSCQQTSQQSTQQINMRRNSEQATKISEIYDSNVEKTSITQSQTSISNQVNNTNLISISYQGSRQPHPQTDQKPPERVQSGRGSYDVSDTTVVCSSETARVVDSQRTSESRVHQENEAISAGILAGKTRKGNKRNNENIQQIRHRKELEEASMSQEQLGLDYQGRVQKDDAEDGVRESSQTMVMPPRSQSLSRSSLSVELESGFQSQKISNTTSEGGSSSSYVDSRRQPLTLQHDLHERSKRAETYGEPLYLPAPEDALGSVDRLQQSSAQFLGEFVEKARHEASASEIQRVEEFSETTLASEDDKNRQKVSTQNDSEDLQPKEQDKGHSSGGSGSKGPSDEMWDVSDPFVLKTPKAEEPEATTTVESAIVKRSGRSLWNIIGDIITLKWGSHSETPTSASRSGRRIPSNESAASEAWFSTHESEQSKDKPASDKGCLQWEKKSDHPQVTELPGPAHGNELDRFTDQTRDPEADPSPSTTKMESGSTSKRISLSGDENQGWNEGSKSLRTSPSGIEIMESPLQRIVRGERTTIISQISDTRNTKSGLVEQIEQYEPAKVSEVPGAEGSGGGELKRRKLQRIKQVPKDRFDEWEEAFTLEKEQRKQDEMFMREALVEAKKAADTWEVPVGAVLVHNGTIIARGYNLVEELRDSTAHAEMICIREASNQLRSWRLADTTLYVTLEPCPMCAGAILQARISTLVWGAPNKLLGADGSWIRLFPDGGDRGNTSEVSDKPAAPVHPFHPKMDIRRGVLAIECAEVMQQFFQLRRKNKEKQAVAEESPSSRLSISHHPSKILKKVHDIFHVMFCL